MFNAVSKATAENTELAELFQTNLGLVQDSQKVLPPPSPPGARFLWAPWTQQPSAGADT